MMRISRVLFTVVLITIMCASLASAQIELTLTSFSGYEARMQWLETVAEEFMRLHPDVTVNVILAGDGEITTMHAAGSAPDVMWMGQSWGAHLGYLLPLEDFIEADPDFMDLFLPFAQGLYEFDGHTWSIIFSTSIGAMFYNAETLAKLGYQNPTSDWTWSEAIEMMKAATKDTDGDGFPNEWGLGEGWQPWGYFSYDGDIYEADMRTARMYTPLRLATCQLFQDIWSGALGIMPSGYVGVGVPLTTLFAESRLAFFAGGGYNIDGFRQSASFDWDIQVGPQFEYEGELYKGGYWSPEGVAISAHTEYPDLSWELVKLMFSDDMYEIIASSGQIMPVTQAGARAFMYQPTPPTNLGAFIEAMESAVSYAMNPAFDNIMKYVFHPIWNQDPPHDGSLPMEQILRQSHDALQVALDEFYAVYDAR